MQLFANIPEELKQNGLWCMWRYEKRGDKMTKPPYCPQTGKHAKSNDKSTFSDYNTAIEHIMEYIPDGGIGLGIFNGYSAFDIDDCIDGSGNISAMAQEIIKSVGSYTERSPSGHGIRIIFKTNYVLDKSRYYIHREDIGLEVYISDNTNKFVTITGDVIGEARKIAFADVSSLMDKYMVKNTPSVRKTPEKVCIGLETAIAKDGKLSALWNGTAPGSGANESELDLALCEKLAFYCNGDPSAVDRAFRSSPYFQSKDAQHVAKWERDDYRNGTISTAVESASKYRPSPSASAPQSKAYTLDDTGNSHRFADTFGDVVKYNVDNKLFMIWNGKYWETDYRHSVKNYVELMSEQMKAQAYRINDNDDMRKAIMNNIRYLRSKSGKDNCLAEASHVEGMPMINDDFDRQDWLLCTDSGVVNLENAQIAPFDKSLYMSKSTHCECDLEHEPVRFVKYLKDIIKNHPEMYDYLHRLFGYALTNSVREQEMYILYGDGNDGKSLLLEVLSDVIGDYAHTAMADLIIERKDTNKSLTQVAQLKGSRFVSLEEIKPDDRLNEANVKMYTSGLGKITGKFLYANEFTFNFKGKLFMATNYEPRVIGTDKGIWRRIRIIPFDRSLKDSEVDKDLKSVLMTEKAQILGWLVRGCAEYREKGLDTPSCVLSTTKSYQSEQDVILSWIEDRCDTSKDYAVTLSSVLYKDYVNWCAQNHEYTMSQTLFGKNLGKKFKKNRLYSGKVYYGIEISQSAKDISKARVAEKMDGIDVDGDI